MYSLGVLGYEILTLSNPFGSGSRHELFTAHLRGDPSDLPWEVKARDPELGEILLRCLQKEPARRPRAEEVFRALTDGSGGGGASSGPAPGTPMAVLAPFPRLAAFASELGRRRVVRVAIAYLVGALLLLQGAGDVLGGLEAPTWIYRMLVVVAVGGLPVVLVLSWVFDVTSKGIERTEPTEGGSGRALKIAGLVGSIVLATLIGWFFLGGQ